MLLRGPGHAGRWKSRGEGGAASVSQRAAVLARLGAAQEHAARLVDPDPLVAAVDSGVLGDVVPLERQVAHDAGRHAALEVERAAVLHDLAGGLARALVVEARSVARLLHVHPEI